MPVFSIIVPYFRSRSTVAYALESAQRASQGLDVEILLVDDGSMPPAEEDLKGLRHGPHRIIRQENRGLLFARLRGLLEARGDYILFLDADDLIGSQKLRAALDAFADPEVVTVYTDTAKVRLDGEYGDLMIKLDPATPKTEDMAEFFITIQPAPHSPVFRATFLRELVATPLFPPLPAYNPVAEIWFYFNAAVRPGKVRHVPGPETICGVHGGERITNCWKKWRWHPCWPRRPLCGLAQGPRKRWSSGEGWGKRCSAAGGPCPLTSCRNIKNEKFECGNPCRNLVSRSWGTENSKSWQKP